MLDGYKTDYKLTDLTLALHSLACVFAAVGRRSSCARGGGRLIPSPGAVSWQLGCYLGYKYPHPASTVSVGVCVLLYFLLEGGGGYWLSCKDKGLLAEAVNDKARERGEA